MSETATPEAGPEHETRGLNIGEFHLDTASGGGWTYRMYLHDDNAVKVNRVYPDPERGQGIAEATRLDRYDEHRTKFTFPAAWAANGNADLAETAIVNAYRRALRVTASIRFGDFVFVMSTEARSGVVRVVDEQDGTEPRWVATLTALHKDYMQVQISTSPVYKDVFGADVIGETGQAARYRLARAASTLARSAHRWCPAALPNQANRRGPDA
ncbi:hypothetical protein [Glycomyces sp. NPDC048151]|uniref:hypothetical protein n=1 Tax=Glycomyces sp. NPDC048151 TaxID=3364002 RepID=UPI00371543CA